MPDNHKPTAHVESSKSSTELLLQGEKQKWGRETGFEQPVVFHGAHDQRRYVLSQLDKMKAIKPGPSFHRFSNARFSCKMQQKNFHNTYGWLFDVPREILFPSVHPVPCDIPLPIHSKH
jgi:hypothetical protein